MKESYTQAELDALVESVSDRVGWNFSAMRTVRQPVPWEYGDIVRQYLTPTDAVLDVGTGGGERFIELAPYFGSGLGVDIDPTMIEVAQKNATGIENIRFLKDDVLLEAIDQRFDVITNRHCRLDIGAITKHLKPSGFFITQQVGERNMFNIKQTLNQEIHTPVVTREEILQSGMKIVEFREYDVEYVVKDIESLVFWLKALDMLHADLNGHEAISDVAKLNAILKNNVDECGFVTNEQRYLVVAQA